jgi:hypothetical protein
MTKMLLFLPIILVSSHTYSADQDPDLISEHFAQMSISPRSETKTLELELKGTIAVHNNCTEPMWVRVAGINLCAHTGFSYDEKTGKQTVLFESVWSSKLKYLEVGESKDINYLFLKTWPFDQKILIRPVLHYTFFSNCISQGYVPFELCANGGPVMKITVPDSTNACTPVPEIISVKSQCDYKKMARGLLDKHIQFVSAKCNYHRDAISILRQCQENNDLSAPELGTKMLKNLNTHSPQNTHVDE